MFVLASGIAPDGRRQTLACRRRKALVITETELKLIAAAAATGGSSTPKNGYRTPAASGTPARCKQREEQILPDARQRRAAQAPRPQDAAEIALHQRHPALSIADIRSCPRGDAHVRPVSAPARH